MRKNVLSRSVIDEIHDHEVIKPLLVEPLYASVHSYKSLDLEAINTLRHTEVLIDSSKGP